MGWASSTVMQWCPTWLSEELGFDIKGAGFISALPPLVGFAVATGSGLLGAHEPLADDQPSSLGCGAQTDKLVSTRLLAAATHLIGSKRCSVSTVRKVSQFSATTLAALPLLMMAYIPGL